jgi:hypothetical protein
LIESIIARVSYQENETLQKKVPIKEIEPLAMTVTLGKIETRRKRVPLNQIVNIINN